ncbi:PH domain containing protein [Trypanosoma brucei equiperdum]|uniref:PH domain containing protein n=1 Tax=Trypanosoma brucei equiperdum TaxID=630700 RepID=A0A3L6KU51_9TRYP|nr:PH domain containing protein [Trypanosoma brucei equiperdum]
MSSAVSALTATIGVLRRLLNEEKTDLEQLTYVVQCIHDPILECYNSPNDGKQGQWLFETPNVASILTATEHRDIFGNIFALYNKHKWIVSRLESALREPNRKQENGAEATGQSNSNSKENAEAAALRDVVELFCSNEMQQFITEHLKYSLSYSSTIAPKILGLWHRCCPTHAKNVTGKLSLDSGFIRVVDKRGELSFRKRFLCFLWWTLGERSGVPMDPRAVRVRLPDSLSPATAPPASTGQGHPCAFPPLKSNAGEGHSNGRPGSVSNAIKMTFSSPSAGWEESLIPPTWQGFETLLALLATPLPSLRRYVHVACCIVNTHCLQRSVRQQLQFNFVTLARQRMAEENCMVLNELIKQDTGHITSLIDGAGAASADKAKAAALLPGYTAKKFARVDPDKDGCRVLIHYGRLTKKFRRGRHERLVFLFNDWFCYGEEHVNNQLLLRASLSLDGLKVVDHSNVEDGDNSFDVVTQKMRFSFIAPTQEQKRQWVDALLNTVRLYEKRLSKPQQPSNSSGGDSKLAVRKTVSVLPTKSVRLTRNSRLVRQQRVDRLVQGQLSMRRAASATQGAVSDEEAVGPVAMQDTLVAPDDVGGLQDIESPLQQEEVEVEKDAADGNVVSDDGEWAEREQVDVAAEVESDDSGDIVGHEGRSSAEGEGEGGPDAHRTLGRCTEELRDESSGNSKEVSGTLQGGEASTSLEDTGGTTPLPKHDSGEPNDSYHRTNEEPGVTRPRELPVERRGGNLGVNKELGTSGHEGGGSEHENDKEQSNGDVKGSDVKRCKTEGRENREEVEERRCESEDEEEEEELCESSEGDNKGKGGEDERRNDEEGGGPTNVGDMEEVERKEVAVEGEEQVEVEEKTQEGCEEAQDLPPPPAYTIECVASSENEASGPPCSADESNDVVNATKEVAKNNDEGIPNGGETVKQESNRSSGCDKICADGSKPTKAAPEEMEKSRTDEAKLQAARAEEKELSE